jgi:hypothetical protein
MGVFLIAVGRFKTIAVEPENLVDRPAHALG